MLRYLRFLGFGSWEEATQKSDDEHWLNCRWVMANFAAKNLLSTSPVIIFFLRSTCFHDKNVFTKASLCAHQQTIWAQKIRYLPFWHRQPKSLISGGSNCILSKFREMLKPVLCFKVDIPLHPNLPPTAKMRPYPNKNFHGRPSFTHAFARK